MILFEITGTEGNAVYRKLEAANGNRQYSFLESVVEAALEIGRPFLSQHVIKALNFHAITCLHASPGEYRPCEVTVGTHQPPAYYRVPALMDDFVNTVNRNWETVDPVALATYVLWRLNYIHPFINGNGRTARAACYFVLCLKAGGLIAGAPILPELIRRNRDEYVVAIQAGDASFHAGGLDLSQLHGLVSRLLREQLQSAGIDPDQGQAPPSPDNSPSA